MDDISKDMDESQRIAQMAGPKIKELFMQIPNLFVNNDLLIYPVENQKINILKQLDKSSGIDYYVVSKSANRTVALAWRAIKCKYTQYPNNGVYNAFSIRQKRNKIHSEENCELNKRTDAIKFGLVYPEFTAQAHYDPLDNDSLLSLAIARTSDIYEAFNKGLYRVCNPNGKNKEVFFYDVFWCKMKENGYNVYDWYRDPKCEQTAFLNEIAGRKNES